jgi:hypothetical protein
VVQPAWKKKAGRASQKGSHIDGVSVVVLGYVWRVLTNIFYVAVVLYVFDALHGRPEAITVAVLGLVYATIRSVAIGQAIGLSNALKIIEVDLVRIRELLNDEHAQTRWRSAQEDAKTLEQTRIKLYIDGFFLSIVSLICLFVLYSALQR